METGTTTRAFSTISVAAPDHLVAEAALAVSAALAVEALAAVAPVVVGKNDKSIHKKSCFLFRGRIFFAFNSQHLFQMLSK